MIRLLLATAFSLFSLEMNTKQQGIARNGNTRAPQAAARANAGKVRSYPPFTDERLARAPLGARACARARARARALSVGKIFSLLPAASPCILQSLNNIDRRGEAMSRKEISIQLNIDRRGEAMSRKEISTEFSGAYRPKPGGH